MILKSRLPETILVAALAMTSTGFVWAADVLFSTSFDEGIATWRNPLSLGGPATWTDEEAHSGLFSVRLDSAWFYHTDILPTNPPNQLVKVEFWGKGAEVRNGSRYVGAASEDWRLHTYFAWYPNQATWLGFDTRNSTVPFHFDDLTVETATAADYYSHIQAGFDRWGVPVLLNQASETQTRLPKTFQALTGGSPLNIVMLGDSIINDMYASAWANLLELKYPSAPRKIVASVRNSTGMDWYASETDENGDPVDRIQDWVMVHDPDFVIIGGISHNDNSEAYRTVIQKIRERDSSVEILICTGMSGRTDPRDHADWQFEVDPSGDSLASRLYRIAEEENVGFLDAQASWDRYIRDAGFPYSEFKRDTTHMNQNGTYIAAEVLYQYFSRPTSAAITLLNSSVTETNFSFQFQSQSNLTYTVESCGDLPATNWSALDTVIGDGSVKGFVTPHDGAQQRFFRVRQP